MPPRAGPRFASTAWTTVIGRAITSRRAATWTRRRPAGRRANCWLPQTRRTDIRPAPPRGAPGTLFLRHRLDRRVQEPQDDLAILATLRTLAPYRADIHRGHDLTDVAADDPPPFQRPGAVHQVGQNRHPLLERDQAAHGFQRLALEIHVGPQLVPAPVPFHGVDMLVHVQQNVVILGHIMQADFGPL